MFSLHRDINHNILRYISHKGQFQNWSASMSHTPGVSHNSILFTSHASNCVIGLIRVRFNSQRCSQLETAAQNSRKIKQQLSESCYSMFLLFQLLILFVVYFPKRQQQIRFFSLQKNGQEKNKSKKKKPLYDHNMKKPIRYVGYIWSHQILRGPSKLNMHFFIFCKSCFLSFSVLHFLSARRCGEFCRAFTLILFSPSATHPPSTTSQCVCACVRVFVSDLLDLKR